MIVKEKVMRQEASSLASQQKLYGVLLLAAYLVVVLIYFLFTDGNLGGADSAELITASYNLGIAHPPGYPLFMVAGKLFSILAPFKNVIFTYNLFATSCFLVSLIILWQGLKILEIHPLSVLIVAAFFVFSPTSIQWFTTGEVFSLHILICSAGIYCTIVTIKTGRISWPARLLGLVAGLGASNHHSIVFLFPGFFLVYAYFWFRLENNAARAKELAWLILFTLMGFAFYLQPVLTTMLHDRTVSALGLEVWNLKDLADLFLRRMYGTFSMAGINRADLVPGFWLLHYLRETLFTWQGLGPFVGFLAFCFIIKSIVAKKSLLTVVSISWLVFSLSFFLLINTMPSEVFEQDIIPRMYLMPNLIISFCALLFLNELINRILRQNNLVLITIASFSAVFFLWFTVWNSYQRVPRNPIDIQLQNGKDLLASCPEKGLLLLSTDASIFSVFYLQKVLGFREDILTVAWPMRAVESYRSRILGELSEKISRYSGKEKIKVPTFQFTSKELVAILLKAGSGVNIQTKVKDFFKGKEGEHFTAIDRGITKSLLAPGAEKPKPQEILADNISSMQAYLAWLALIDPLKQSSFDAFIIDTYRQYFIRMRNLQLELGQIVLPIDLLEQVCIMIKKLDPDDMTSDYYLGLFYTKFRRDQEHARFFMQTFVDNTSGRQEYSVMRERALQIINLLGQDG